MPPQPLAGEDVTWLSSLSRGFEGSLLHSSVNLRARRSVSRPSFVERCRPPWVVFLELDPRELAGYLRQGLTEAYLSTTGARSGARSTAPSARSISTTGRHRRSGSKRSSFTFPTTRRSMLRTMSASRTSTWRAIARSVPLGWGASRGGRGGSNPASERGAAGNPGPLWTNDDDI